MIQVRAHYLAGREARAYGRPGNDVGIHEKSVKERGKRRTKNYLFGLALSERMSGV